MQLRAGQVLNGAVRASTGEEENQRTAIHRAA